MNVVRARADLLERSRVESPLLGNAPRNRIEPKRGELHPLDEPSVRPIRAADDTGERGPLLGGKVLPKELVHGGCFDHMVVNTHEDHVIEVHEALPQKLVKKG